LWSGKAPAVRCPTISPISISTPIEPEPGDTLKASIETADPQKQKLEIRWSLVKEMSTYNVTGTGAKATTDYSSGIAENGLPAVSMKLPTEPGIYRIYCEVRNTSHAAAVASSPIKIKGRAEKAAR